MSFEQIRPVIDCFCQILSLYGFTNITSDIFHLAKFDQNQATKSLWRLIYEMIHFDNPTFSKERFDQIPKHKLIDIIKIDLYKRGYTYEQFLLIDNQMEKGSRQLLICLAWLICHMRFIEKCMKQCLNSILNLDQKDDNLDGKDDLIEQIKLALRSNRKIRSRLQTVESINCDETCHLSSFELQLCQYPHLISQYLTELDHEQNKLNLFLYWNKHEDIFWKWMESVLDQPNPLDNNETNYQCLEAEKQKFNAAIDTLDSVLIRLQQLCLSNNDHTLIKDDISSIITSIDMEISSLFNQLSIIKSFSK